MLFVNYNKGLVVVQVAEGDGQFDRGVVRDENRCFRWENNENRKIVVLKAKSSHGFMSHLLKWCFLFCTIVHLAKKRVTW